VAHDRDSLFSFIIAHSSYTELVGRTRVDITVGSAAIAGLTDVTDRQTDRQTTLVRLISIGHV